MVLRKVVLVLFFFNLYDITRWLKFPNVLSLIFKGSAQLTWTWYIFPVLKQHHNPLWMYTVSKLFCIHDEGSERIQKKHYSEIGMAVLIHFTWQDFHTIFNAKLFSIIDIVWLTVKAGGKNTWRIILNWWQQRQLNTWYWNLSVIVFKISVKWGMLKDRNVYIYI